MINEKWAVNPFLYSSISSSAVVRKVKSSQDFAVRILLIVCFQMKMPERMGKEREYLENDDQGLFALQFN